MLFYYLELSYLIVPRFALKLDQQGGLIEIIANMTLSQYVPVINKKLLPFSLKDAFSSLPQKDSLVSPIIKAAAPWFFGFTSIKVLSYTTLI